MSTEERTLYLKESVSGLPEISEGNYNCLFLNKLINGFVSVEFTDKYLKIMIVSAIFKMVILV